MTTHLDDLDADFLRFYRINGFHDMEAPRFFSLANRVAAFKGVMYLRAMAEEQAQQDVQSRASKGRTPSTHAAAVDPVKQRFDLAKRGGEVERVDVIGESYLSVRLAQQKG